MTNIDEILHDFLDDCITQVKSDVTLIDQIFEGKAVERIESIKQWVSAANIKTVYNWPRDNAEIPCYAIVLENSNESDQTIGSSGDPTDEVIISRMDDGWIGSDSDILRSNIFGPVDVKQFYSTVESRDGRRICHLVGDQTDSLNKGIWIDFEHSVLDGGYISLVGIGYVSIWVKSTRTGSFLTFGFGETAHEQQTFAVPITVKGFWQRIRIDIRKVANRDKDMIRFMSFKITNADLPVDIRIDSLLGEKSALAIYDEFFFDHRYRIECWTNNAELTLALHDIAKWFLLKSRTYLQKSWGLIRQRVEAGDIMPQPDFYPEFAYIRGISFSSTTLELVPREEELTALDVEVGRTDYGV